MASLKTFRNSVSIRATESRTVIPFNMVLRLIKCPQSAGGLNGLDSVVWIGQHHRSNETLVGPSRPYMGWCTRVESDQYFCRGINDNLTGSERKQNYWLHII
jgi:hypothetical protein